jgi:anthranilate/para-aminobenzoate synthase component II
MKILLINNHTRHLPALSQALTGNDVEIQMYHPGLNFHEEDKDLIILSGGGGEGMEIDDVVVKDKLWYEDEMEFVLKTKKPMLGICMGFEVICRAYGQNVNKMGMLIEGFRKSNTTGKGQKLLGKQKLRQFEAHQWFVPEAPKGFKVLADSDTGIEVISDSVRKRFATQFHPEKGGSLHLSRLLKQTA